MNRIKYFMFLNNKFVFVFVFLLKMFINVLEIQFKGEIYFDN